MTDKTEPENPTLEKSDSKSEFISTPEGKFSNLATLRLIRNLEEVPLLYLISQVETTHDHRVLGHLPYNETP